MGTNVMIALVASILIYSLGAVPFLLVQLPILLLASSIGVWLFYVQHQFEDTSWTDEQPWDIATLDGWMATYPGRRLVILTQVITGDGVASAGELADAVSEALRMSW